MKHLLLFTFNILAFLSCSNPSKTDSANQQTIEENTSIGGERDEHGCFISAGETWSKMKEECVQIFNEGLRLNPVEIKEEDDAVFSSFVIFNEERTELELFLPGEDRKSVILSSSDKILYKSGAYEYDSSGSTLYIDGKVSYVAREK